MTSTLTIGERLATASAANPIQLGRYDVVGRIGQGGMGTVYDAVDRERGAPVALKTLKIVNPDRLLRLKREFRQVSDLTHPNLVTLFELACVEGMWFFTMERIEGLDFNKWLRGASAGDVVLGRPEPSLYAVDDASTLTVGDEPGTERSSPLQTPPHPSRSDASLSRAWSHGPPQKAHQTESLRSEHEIREALGGLVRGVMALHEAGLCHGDLKPSNVLVQDDGRVLVLDFGLVQPHDEASIDETWGASSSRGSSDFAGTPRYMAPEQMNGEGRGQPSDWFAVGIMLYEALTGTLPFWGRSTLELYLKKTRHTPAIPHKIRPDVPRDLSEVCLALLQPDPMMRPDGAELLRVFGGDAGARASMAGRIKRSVFVGRGPELLELERAFASAAEGRVMLAHVRGPSGIGKSALVRSFLSGIQELEQGRVLRGRCYERETVPYKGFDGIIDALADWLATFDPDALSAALPESIGELVAMFPTLDAVAAIRERTGTRLTIGAKQRRRRAWAALGELLAELTTQQPLLLYIDDLQWADADSVALLNTLLTGPWATTARLLVVASFRVMEADTNPFLESHFALARGLETDARLVTVEVEVLDVEESLRMAHALLHTDAPALEAEIKNLAVESGGVPIFIEQLTRFVSLQVDRAPTKLTLDEVITSRVRSLPDSQRALIEVLAVADSPVGQLVALESAELDAESLPDLLALRGAGLLSWSGPNINDSVSVYHDRIRESVVSALPRQRRLAYHLALGRALSNHGRLAMDGAWAFDVVHHYDVASSLVSDPAERRSCASWNLIAGRFAKEAAAFPRAFQCFVRGIGSLDDDAWTQDYDLALGLHLGAAETAYLSNELEALERYAAEVQRYSHTILDQIVVWEVRIDASIGQQCYQEAVDIALEALTLFDVHLPRDPDQAEVGAAIAGTLAVLAETSPDRFAAMPDVEDEVINAARRIQIRISPAAYFAAPLLLPMVACNLVETSAVQGLSSATPFALALFGIVLNTLEMYPTAHAWGQVAVALLDRWEDRSLEACTRHVVHNLVCVWMVPLADILDDLRDVFDIGMRVGDYEYAAYAAHGYVHNAMYASRPLVPLLEEAKSFSARMNAMVHVNALHIHLPFARLLHCLVGQTEDPSRLDGQGFNEAEALATAVRTGSISGIFIHNTVMGLARYYFGDPQEASTFFEIARDNFDAAPSVWHRPIVHQFSALAAAAAWPALDAAERAQLLPRIHTSLEALETLSSHTPSNFAHRVSFVKGALARIAGDRELALACFRRAAAQAEEGGWGNDAGLGHELVAACSDEPDTQAQAIDAASACYEAWGAVGLVKKLERARVS